MALLSFIVILIVLVWVHELGHFSAAKLFGIRVDEFAIGFPPRLFTIEWGETRYSFNLLLVGGYVSIHGESGETHDPRSFTAKSRPVHANTTLNSMPATITAACTGRDLAVKLRGSWVSPDSPWMLT